MIRNENPVIANSLWSATTKYADSYPELNGEQQADVAVIGAGFTGLSAALHLAEAGASVTLIDAQHPGWGASGRNGGQINVGLKDGPTGIRSKFGDHWGERMIRMAGDAGDLVFDLIERHQINCDAKRPGWLRAAHTPKTLQQLHGLAEDWDNHGGGMNKLDQAEMQRLTGTEAYIGGVLDRRGGVLHPLNYALGLADAAHCKGVAIYGDTPAEHIQAEGGRHRVKTPNGAIMTDKVLICTNAYSGDLDPKVAKSVLPVRSVQVATQPLSDNIRRSILPEGNALSDARRLLLYFRQDAEGRFLMGGRGTYNDGSTRRQIERLKRISAELFPQLADVEWDYAWGGFVALTRDHYPHLHELAPGIYAGLGYNGRGVAIATAMGRVLARWAAGEPAEKLDFPVTPLKPLPLSFARETLVEAEILRLKLLDKLGL
ncbi:Gamma-glutamylputrescine oxidoreductase [Falsiruegeria litorea R37]|uniref:Gamma-glutamylputrescine oxidoreductase n=1 Tax=Falsiruegeria litorea R37 TaxID=1200284 RepID=A0A1Y5RNZ8_9RHOB|nr:FAD-binding oxidoreductase [Falsiruegeria litorea]SLN19209.1 Gamma-glutamylputrescine oxidoreductase [Falsiruegeria litorea R37]